MRNTYLVSNNEQSTIINQELNNQHAKSLTRDQRMNKYKYEDSFNSNSSNSHSFFNSSLDQSKLCENPFRYINDQTTRDNLFQIIYLLEEQNTKLVTNFDEKVMRELENDQFQKLRLSGKDRRLALQEINKRNDKLKAEASLFEMYTQQEALLIKEISSKQKQTDLLIESIEQKKESLNKLDQKITIFSSKLHDLKDQKAKLTEELRKKNNLHKSGESGIIDRLLGEYYDTVKVINRDDSIERIKKNNQLALGQISLGAKSRTDIFSFMFPKDQNHKNLQ